MDRTVYIENIPSNQIENWARIQADRFKNVVIRGFHTGSKRSTRRKTCP